jgi:hypothetical protein
MKHPDPFYSKLLLRTSTRTRLLPQLLRTEMITHQLLNPHDVSQPTGWGRTPRRYNVFRLLNKLLCISSQRLRHRRKFKTIIMSPDAPETDKDEQVQHEAEVVAVLDVDVAPEADPDGDKWDDVDAEDSDDPLMSANMLSRSSST